MRRSSSCNPLLAGLGDCTRSCGESIGASARRRPAVSSLAVMMSTSTIAISMPFAGALAWTTVLLVAAAGISAQPNAGPVVSRGSRSARSPGRRWRAAHLCHGLVIATAFATVYLVAGASPMPERGSSRADPPRVGWRCSSSSCRSRRSRSSCRMSSSSASRACAAATARSATPGQSEVGDPLGSNGVWAGWPLGFAAAPGAYAGAVALACALLAARARRLRTLVVAVGGLALAAYVLTLPAARDGRLVPRPSCSGSPSATSTSTTPGGSATWPCWRCRSSAAAGLQGLVERPLSPRAAFAWLGAAALAFVALAARSPAATLVRFAMVAAILAGGARRCSSGSPPAAGGGPRASAVVGPARRRARSGAPSTRRPTRAARSSRGWRPATIRASRRRSSVSDAGRNRLPRTRPRSCTTSERTPVAT